MNTTTYQRRHVASPVQTSRREAFNVQSEKHPAREEIEQLLGHHSLTLHVEEDQQTLMAMKDTEGIIAFLATLTKDGRVLSQGRGSVVLSPTNKWLSRAIGCAFNSALSDAVIRATKVLDTFRTKPDESDAEEAMDEVYRERASQPASDKQKQFIEQLVHMNVQDESEKEQILANLSEITKQEASKMIEMLRS